MELSTYLVWNVFITLILAPLLFSIRKNETELKRLDILLNKTREEIPSKYVTKEDQENDISRLFERLDKLDQKIDKLIAQ
jgi:archaellum component FlaC|tara:strand:- start:1861 stop:2100 length:240 start_codon:yes stop_codon:yes gene_type:complete